MEPVGPLPAWHQAAGELVDDHHLIVLDHVVDVALVEVVGLEGVVDEMRPFHVARGVETLDTGEFFREPHALLGEADGMLFLLDFEVFVSLELPRDLVGPRIL